MMSQRELARRSGVARSQIGRIEGGEVAHVRGSTVRKLARALGVEPRVLAGEPGGSLELPRVRKEEELMDVLKGLGEPELELVVRVASGLGNSRGAFGGLGSGQEREET